MGLFITFEGGEGAGKSTLIEGIFRSLESAGHAIVKTREPGGTTLGEQIRTLLLQDTPGGLSPYTELSLFLASRAQHIRDVIAPALKENKIVLCDRFNDSSIAYQGAARGLGKEKVTEICQFFSQGVVPDLTLYLDIDPELGLNRAKERHSQDRIESEEIAFHTKIREAYRAIHKENPDRFKLLDATLSPGDVYAEAMKWIGPLLSRV